MPSNKSFVRVRSRSRIEVIADEIHAHGFPADYAEILALRLVESGCIPPEEQAQDSIRGLLWNLREDWEKHQDTDILTLTILFGLVQREVGLDVRRFFQEPPWKLPEGASFKFVEKCVADTGLDFTAALERTSAFVHTLADRNRSRTILDMAQVLWQMQVVDPERLIDVSQLEALGHSEGVYGDTWDSEQQRRFEGDIRSPAFWIAVHPQAALRGFESALRDASDERLALLCRGLTVCELRTWTISGIGSVRPPPRETILWAFRHIDSRVGDDPRRCAEVLRQTWLELWRELWWKNRIDDDPSLRKRLLVAADYELGRLRPIIAEADATKFTKVQRAIDAASTCCFECSTLWNGLRPLLLAFRALPVPGVGTDLRYWSDQFHIDPPLPEPWNRIASLLVGNFHSYAKAEQAKDPELHELREEFSRFCLDRLKSKDGAGGPRESNPDWRRGYIHAALALKINPGGKGHHTLHHASEHDPDPDVRALAKEAYVELRHNPSLGTDTSPRRCVLLAFWMLRAAHLYALGHDVDQRLANRIREEEVRRTTESERTDSMYK